MRRYPQKGRKLATENKHPEKTAHALEEMAADPLARFEEIAESCGLPKKTLQILKSRLQRRWVPVNDTIKTIRHKELLSLIEDRMLKSLDYMDDVAFAQAPLRDLAMTFGILHDKRQLLLGQPTAILSVQERKDLDDLVPILMQEAQKRGITIDQSPNEVHGEEGVSTFVEAPMNPLPPKNKLPASYRAKGNDLHGVGKISNREKR